MSARLCRLPFFLFFFLIYFGGEYTERELLLLLLFVCALCTELKDPFGNHADIRMCIHMWRGPVTVPWCCAGLFSPSFFLGAANHHRKREKKNKLLFFFSFFFFRNQLGDDGPSVSCSAVHRVVMSFSSFFFIYFVVFFLVGRVEEMRKSLIPYYCDILKED